MAVAPRFASTTFKINNATIIRFSGNGLGVSVHSVHRNDDVGAPLSGCLFVPSQLSVTQMSGWRPILSEPESDSEEEVYYDGVWKQYLSHSAIATKSGACHLSLPLSKILLLTFDEYMDSNKETWDFMNEPSGERCMDEPFFDGPIAVIVDDNSKISAPTRYFSVKEQNLFEIETHSVTNHAFSSVGHWLISKNRPLTLINLRKMSYHEPVPGMKYIGCHLSSPLLDDIEKKDILVLHRFAITSCYFYCYSKPWDCIIMAIDKSSGYLVYNDFLIRGPRSWIVLDSMRNYTNGDLLYFNNDGNFYVLPNAQCGDLEVWRFQHRICSKISEINATFIDGEHHNKSYHHIHSYLVESLNGNLLLVKRYVSVVVGLDDYNESSCNNNPFKTSSFEAFKLNFESKQWEVVSSLGDEALFVGSNSSFSLSSARYPEVIPNSIYFTDQLCHHGGDALHGKDSGIFHLQDCTFTSLFSTDLNCTCAPIWLRPDERPWIEYNQQDDDDDEGGDFKS